MEVFPKMEVLPHWAEVGLEKIQKAGGFVVNLCRNTNVQLHNSDHYVREHFTDEPVQPAEGLPPAKPFNLES